MARRFNSKFKAVRTKGFASKLESAVHDILLIRQKAGEIKDIKCQQSVVLQEGGRDQRINWKVDFSCFEIKTNQTIYVEAKGVETSDFKLKLKLWRAKKPHTLEIWKGNFRRPFLAERIEKDDNLFIDASGL